ncbi:MAG: WecB/TagA/CpsF family glycosyltransferase [Rubritalea sp.]|uniref:WecB/TagA/CpsF family glycosyltransferase n=1 Tax=Rubritalea sp. TaxID=2109375 RepID=UPI003242F47D
MPVSQNPETPSKTMKTVDVICLPVAATNYDAAIDWIFEHARKADRAYAVEAANTHVAALARHDPKFGEVMANFDLICPDGMPLVWSINRSLKKSAKGGVTQLTDRVYGPTLMLKTIEASQRQSDLKHFFLGGAQTTLNKLAERFQRDNPGAIIAGSYSPPFGEWPDDEFERIKSMIEESGANLVWVGLGCPKQERWIAKNKAQLPPACYFGIGAAFAFHAGEIPQAPPVLQKMGLEWLYRMSKEPQRLFKRYLTYNSLFVYYTLKARSAS